MINDFFPYLVESTYGTNIHEKREDRENRFTSTIHDTVTRGGRCLIPVFALGRAQELLLILDEYWAAHPELHEIPIYYASSLAKKCMAVYQTFVNAMNEKINNQIRQMNNPFVFKHISNLKVCNTSLDFQNVLTNFNNIFLLRELTILTMLARVLFLLHLVCRI